MVKIFFKNVFVPNNNYYLLTPKLSSKNSQQIYCIIIDVSIVFTCRSLKKVEEKNSSAATEEDCTS